MIDDGDSDNPCGFCGGPGYKYSPSDDLWNCIGAWYGQGCAPPPHQIIEPIESSVKVEVFQTEDLLKASIAAVGIPQSYLQKYWIAEDPQNNPCLYWRNPFSNEPEILSRFMWPAHPPEWDVDKWWEDLQYTITNALNKCP